ncbi:MAG TPA: DUF4351 domain-containing protein [Thermoanaerobaculia bacterium]|jgi:hypothetical protein|nr:DUF4351 domain-containing protein [Thermoanaerobaculia bacterium]
MAGGHDQLWKDLIQAFPADFVRLAGPDLAARLALDAIEFRPAEVPTGTPPGKERRLDLIAWIESREGERALLHVEIELKFVTATAARLLAYNRLLALRFGLPVQTIALYLHGGPAGAQVVEHSEESLGFEGTRFRYRSLGLSRVRAEDLLARPEPLAWVCAALARPPLRDRRTLRRECLSKIAAARWLDDESRFRLFNGVATYLELDGGAAAEYATLRAAEIGPEAKMRPITWEEKVEARGLEKGMHVVLLRQLERRFPALSGRAIARVQAISSTEELGSLAERLLTARSLEELGLA